MMKRILSNESQHVGENVWYYEEAKGIEVIEQRNNPESIDYSYILIPWRKLASSVGRWAKQKRAREKAKKAKK